MPDPLIAPLPTSRAVITGTKKPFSYNVIPTVRNLVISLDLVKRRLLIDPLDTSFDETITLLIEAVTDYAENYTNLTFINNNFRTFRDFFTNSFELRKSPIQSITNVKFLDIDNILQTVPNTVYRLTETVYQRVFRLPTESWPGDVDNVPDAIQIEFLAGFGADATDVPANIRMAILAHTVSVFAKAGDCCGEVSSVPDVALATYKQNRILSIKIGQSEL